MRQAFSALPEWVQFAIILAAVPIVFVAGSRHGARLRRVAESVTESDEVRQAARKRLRIHRVLGILMFAIMLALVADYGYRTFT